MKNKIIDIKELSDRAALELLCRELNGLRSELVAALDALDGETVIMPDGMTLEERFLEIEKNRN